MSLSSSSISPSSSISRKLRLFNWFSYIYHNILEIDPLFLQFVYFLSVSFLGFCLLLVTKPRVNNYPDNPSKLDLFFTSVSATTTSSMSVIEMEFFSNIQLLILTFLMFIGGDIFISIIGLQYNIARLRQTMKETNLSSISSSSRDAKQIDVINSIAGPEIILKTDSVSEIDDCDLKYNSIRFLGFVVVAYFLFNHILGFILIPIYLAIYPNTQNILNTKSVSSFTFVIFTTVSTFTNCGYIPINENMILFKKNSGLLLILISQILLGNTLYPPCLRFFIWLAGKFLKKPEAEYLLETPAQEICYFHWLSARHCLLLMLSVFGFLLVQFLMFFWMEWKSKELSELNDYESVIGVLFEVVNSRYSGETILDLWNLAPAIWVLFVFMMYIPPYTSYFGTKGNDVDKSRRRNRTAEELMFSPLSYIVIFIILICITERRKIEEDPLNFNALSIVIEVVSAYGNVGFSKGYNCDAQLKQDASCVSKWYGFSGKWSSQGKFILIVTMLFGTLKKYHLNEGRAWKLM